MRNSRVRTIRQKKGRGFTNTQKMAMASVVAMGVAIGYRAVNDSDTGSVLSTAVQEGEVSTETINNGSNIISSDNPYEQCKSDALPSFINVSLTWKGSTYGKALNSLSPPSVVVVAAGNKHPQSIPDEKVEASKDFDAIIVGSIAPDGRRSDFSHTHEEVHIMAPADYHQSSADAEGNRMKFGGTSGAAPLVTGSLASFEWLSGYHPTAEEAKLLLEKTAIPTMDANKDPRLSGVGMLNAYKLGMVGKRLKITCGTDISCFKEMLQKEATYEFPEDPGLSIAVDRAFPECSQSVCHENNSSCENKVSVFNRLRRAAFLNPSNKELWRSMACAYYSSGLKKNAQGAMSIYKAILGKTNTSLYTSCQQDSDCTYVPSCSVYSPGVLLPVNKDYVAACSGFVLCNDKCRCDSQENLSTTEYQQVSCVNSQCISSVRTVSTTMDTRAPATTHTNEQQNEKERSGSIQ